MHRLIDDLAILKAILSVPEGNEVRGELSYLREVLRSQTTPPLDHDMYLQRTVRLLDGIESTTETKPDRRQTLSTTGGASTDEQSTAPTSVED